MLTCPQCGHDSNPSDAEFCDVCGFELTGVTAPTETAVSPSPTPSSPTPIAPEPEVSPPPTTPSQPEPQSDPVLTPDPSFTPEPVVSPPPFDSGPPLQEVGEGLGGAKLVAKAQGPIEEFALDSESLVVGRFDPDTGPVEIDVEGFTGDETVSRQHAEIYLEGGRWIVKDLGSVNGVFIKPAGQRRFGARITQPTPLTPGDELAFGKIRFLFQA